MRLAQLGAIIRCGAHAAIVHDGAACVDRCQFGQHLPPSHWAGSHGATRGVLHPALGAPDRRADGRVNRSATWGRSFDGRRFCPHNAPDDVPPVNIPNPDDAPDCDSASTVPQAPTLDAAAAVPGGYGCADALAYLQAHAVPGFTLECPGWADGHQAMSCDNVAGICPEAKVIAMSVPCPAAYMNEASNSWVVPGEGDHALDPYGYCH